MLALTSGKILFSENAHNLRGLQANWRTVRGAVSSFPGLEDIRLEDVQHMSVLCPEVVFLQDTRRYSQIAKSAPLFLIFSKTWIETIEYVLMRVFELIDFQAEASKDSASLQQLQNPQN